MLFVLLTKKKNIKVLVVLKSCDTAKHMSTDGQFFKKKVVNKLTFMKNCTRLLPLKLITDNGHTVTDDKTIAEELDNDFVNIGKTMADIIASSSTYNLKFHY